ncbi:MAG: hypothetical protein ACR2L2_20650 [Acidobacteriota bacterium]
MTEPESATVQQIESRQDVQKALQQSTGAKAPRRSEPIRPQQKAWLGTSALLVVIFGIAYYALRADLLTFPQSVEPTVQRPHSVFC